MLGKLYHTKALSEKRPLTLQERTKIQGEYSRAIKSELLGMLIFHIEEYLVSGEVSFVFWESGFGKGLLAYIFVLAIGAFVLYYLRSKRLDEFHKH